MAYSQLENSRGHECSSIGKLFSLSWHSASMVSLRRHNIWSHKIFSFCQTYTYIFVKANVQISSASKQLTKLQLTEERHGEHQTRSQEDGQQNSTQRRPIARQEPNTLIHQDTDPILLSVSTSEDLGVRVGFGLHSTRLQGQGPIMLHTCGHPACKTQKEV